MVVKEVFPDGRVILAMAWNVSIGGREDINNFVGMGDAPNWPNKVENGELRIDSGTKWNGTHYYYVMKLPTAAKPDVMEGRWMTDNHPQPVVLYRERGMEIEPCSPSTCPRRLVGRLRAHRAPVALLVHAGALLAVPAGRLPTCSPARSTWSTWARGPARPGSNKDYPPIVLFYPVLDEQESVMRTTMIALDELEYPKDRYRVIAIPNSNDLATVASLKTLQTEFPFLELLEVPPTDHPSWQPVWDAWNSNPKAYWWHHGENAYNKDLPPKKTRQLVYAFYNWMKTDPEEGTLMSYTDADSCPPKDHFLAAAIGSRKYRVMQAKNVAGNAGLTWPSTFCAFDHMAWDGSKYEHLSGDPSQPYWMLGKGLFFHAQDIYDLGGFHPWITIEDPEVGLRLWKNGKNLGIMEGSLIEEAPTTFANAILQRKRWIAGFFQTLKFRDGPMDRMGFSFIEKIKAWLIFLPCLTMSFNCFGLPLSVWAAVTWYDDTCILPRLVLLLVRPRTWPSMPSS